MQRKRRRNLSSAGLVNTNSSTLDQLWWAFSFGGQPLISIPVYTYINRPHYLYNYCKIYILFFSNLFSPSVSCFLFWNIINWFQWRSKETDTRQLKEDHPMEVPAMDDEDETPEVVAARIRRERLAAALCKPNTDQLRRSFAAFDLNSDGELDLSEVKKLLRAGKPSMKDNEIETIFKKVDKWLGDIYQTHDVFGLLFFFGREFVKGCCYQEVWKGKTCSPWTPKMAQNGWQTIQPVLQWTRFSAFEICWTYRFPLVKKSIGICIRNPMSCNFSTNYLLMNRSVSCFSHLHFVINKNRWGITTIGSVSVNLSLGSFLEIPTILRKFPSTKEPEHSHPNSLWFSWSFFSTLEKLTCDLKLPTKSACSHLFTADL